MRTIEYTNIATEVLDKVAVEAPQLVVNTLIPPQRILTCNSMRQVTIQSNDG